MRSESNLVLIPKIDPQLTIGDLLAPLQVGSNSVQQFETAFAKEFAAVEAVAFPYGRSAQWAFLNAVGVRDAEVCLPAYTCSVVAHAVVLSGNRPRFVDIELNTFNMNLDQLEEAIGPKTRAIIATHTFGYPQNIFLLKELADRATARFGHKVWLIQDCAHAFGARWQGQYVNSIGDVGIFGLNLSKLSTSIFGGMLTFQSSVLAGQVRTWRDTHFNQSSWCKGLRRYLYLLGAVISLSEPFAGATYLLQKRTPLLRHWTHAYHRDGKVEFPPDYLSSLSDVEARVGLSNLTRYRERISARQRSAIMLNDNLVSPIGWIKPPLIQGATFSHYSLRVPDRTNVKHSWARRGIELGDVIDYSLPHSPEYRSYANGEFPNSLEASRTAVNLPITKADRCVELARRLYS